MKLFRVFLSPLLVVGMALGMHSFAFADGSLTPSITIEKKSIIQRARQWCEDNTYEIAFVAAFTAVGYFPLKNYVTDPLLARWFGGRQHVPAALRILCNECINNGVQ